MFQLIKFMNNITIFIILCACNVVCNIAQSIIAPFYPNFAKNRGLSESQIGVIFSAQPVGMFFASLMLGKIINESNRASIMSLGIFTQGIGLAMFGILYHVESSGLLITLSLIARFLGGLGAASFMTPYYGFIPILFPTSVEAKIAIAEVSTSTGFLIGPLFGSFLFWLGGFVLAFYFFAGLSFGLFVTLYFIKNQFEKIEIADVKAINEAESEEYLSFVSNAKIEYSQIMLKYPILISYIVLATTNAFWNFQNPIFSAFLHERYGVEENSMGYFLTIHSLVFATTSSTVSCIKRYHKFYIYFGFIISGTLCFFLGPDAQLTGISPDTKWFTLTIWGVVAIFLVFPYVLAVPHFNQVLKCYYPELTFQCANISSALYRLFSTRFNSALAIGGFLGPIAAGILDDHLGYERAISSYGMFVLLVGAIYVPYLYRRKIPPARLL